jgi:hypothetical protein
VWPGQALVGERFGLERQSALEDLVLLCCGEVVVGEEVPQGHGVSLRVDAASSSSGRAATNGVELVRGDDEGGTRRSASGATGLTMNPASRARAATVAGHGSGEGDGAHAARRHALL